MLFSLVKKDFLIVKKYVMIMIIVAAAIPPFMLQRIPEAAGTSGFILAVIYAIFMLMQYVSLKEYQFPKAATLLCAAPFSRRMLVLSKYIFCLTIYVACCILYGIETVFIPDLGALDIRLLAAMFLVISLFIGVYLPIQYKLGYEKTRFIFAVIIIASPVTLSYFLKMQNLNLNFFFELSPYLLCGGIVFAGFAVLAISVLLSVRIYNKADLA